MIGQRVIVKEFGGPEVFQVESFDVFDLLISSCRPDQVVVKNFAFGVNPVETYIRSGLYDPLPSLPYTPGTDGSGEIVHVGSETGFTVGDRVWVTGSVSGTYAQYCVCFVSDVHPLPANLSFDQGAALGIPYRTAYRALVRFGCAKRGESVLVHGASGAVGVATLQIAKQLGMYPIVATCSSDSAAGMLAAAGATEVVRHGCCPVLVDVVIENLANKNLGSDFKTIKKHGRIVIVGNRGETTVNPRDLMRSEGVVTGFVGAGSLEDKANADSFIQVGIETLALQPVVGHTFSLAEIAAAHTEIISHSMGSRGKLIVRTF